MRLSRNSRWTCSILSKLDFLVTLLTKWYYVLCLKFARGCKSNRLDDTSIELESPTPSTSHWHSRNPAGALTSQQVVPLGRWWSNIDTGTHLPREFDSYWVKVCSWLHLWQFFAFGSLSSRRKIGSRGTTSLFCVLHRQWPKHMASNEGERHFGDVDCRWRNLIGGHVGREPSLFPGWPTSQLSFSSSPATHLYWFPVVERICSILSIIIDIIKILSFIYKK